VQADKHSGFCRRFASFVQRYTWHL